MKHTPGPLERSGLNPRYLVGPQYHNRLNHPVTPTIAIVKERIGQTNSNLRLLAAAYNSYDKHCGERAIECAEGDLLGELLEACKSAYDFMIPHIRAGASKEDQTTFLKLADAIAKPEGNAPIL